MDKTPTFRKLAIRNNHNCFGCGPTNPSGLHMTFYTDGKSLFSDIVIPDHMGGWKNFAHGGVISTILDEVMGWAAIYLLKRLVLTKSMAVDFLKPVYLGKPFRAEARLSARESEREAVMEGFLCSPDGMVYAKSRGIFAVFKPDAAHKLGMTDEQIMKDLEPLMNGEAEA